jgi:tartrate-resistant acid phosphatase type 5
MQSDSLSRRRFLARSFAFSAAGMLGGCGWGVTGATPPEADPVTGGVAHILMVGDWGESGAGGSFNDQATVAASMQAYANKYNLGTDALLMLGDNFYGDLPGGAASTRWQTQFENIYPQNVFNCPAYAIPGNHDYQYAPAGVSKYQAELAYLQQNPLSRWTMPSQYYSFMFPLVNPMVTFIALDSNMPNEPAQPIPPDPSFYTMTDANRQTQLAWLTAQLALPLTTPFLVVIGHHPLYSDGLHGDNHTLINDWGPLFKQHGVHMYLAGHDHDMQHLEFSHLPTSFVGSGGGGSSLYTLRLQESQRGPFAVESYGFSHLQVRPDLMIFRHLDENGNLLHKFTKAPDGTVTILF